VKTFSASPVLRVSNTEAALQFYRDTLGFTVEFQYDDYLGLQLDQAGLHLCQPAPGKLAGGGTVYVFCDEVDTYFGIIRGRGAKPATEPCNQFYGMRDFVIHDPDGNQLSFGCSLEKEDCAKD
jgi:uncharacterized glyoxalase superfamily protein PhnB